mgnify:FL=1
MAKKHGKSNKKANKSKKKKAIPILVRIRVCLRKRNLTQQRFSLLFQ